MKVSRKVRIVILILLFALLAVMIASVAIFAVKSHDNVAVMHNALHALERKDYDEAADLFSQVLKLDKDNETATVKLAEIYEIKGNWPMATYFWIQACRLNTLKEDYEKRFITAAMRGRFFSRVKVQLIKERDNEKIGAEKLALMTYVSFMCDDQRNGIEFWRTLQNDYPEAAKMPMVRLIKLSFFSRDATIGNMLDELEQLTKNSDPVVAQESTIALVNLNRILKQNATQLELLKKFMGVNYYIGAPMLGEFYTNHQMYPEACEIFEPYLKEYSSGRIASVYAELLVFTNQNAKLDELIATWKKKHDRDSMTLTYYFEALAAFLKKDFTAMKEAYTPARNRVKTPLSSFVGILSDIQANDTSTLHSDLQQFLKYPPFWDLQNRVHLLTFLYIQDRAIAGAPLRELADIAKLLQNSGLSTQEPERNLQLINVIAKLEDGSLKEPELNEFFKGAENDPTALEIFASFYFNRKNYDKAWQYCAKFETLGQKENSEDMKKIAINILINQNKLQEANARISALLKEKPNAENVRNCFFYAVANKQKDILLLLNSLDTPDAIKYRTIGECALMLIEDKRDEALAKLELFDSEDNELLYFVAIQMMENKRADSAIKFLGKIKDDFPEYINVLTALSRLYIEKKQPEQAQQYARKALEIMPTSSEANLCLALCYRADNNWEKALDVSNPTLWTNDPEDELKGVWAWATEQKIKSEFDAGRMMAADRLCSQLLRYVPNSEVAKEYAAKIHEKMQADQQQQPNNN